jgi:hypothetical protein
MSIWLCKDKDNLVLEELENYENIIDGDIVYIYSDDNVNSGFSLVSKLSCDSNALTEDTSFSSINIDLPYTLFYQTKRSNRLVKMKEEETNFILQNIAPVAQQDIKILFGEYIETLSLKSKKIPRRIKYLDEILPIRIDADNPVSIFTIDDINILNNIKNKLAAKGEYYSWDREGSYVGEVLQTVKMYIDFLKITKIPSTTVKNSAYTNQKQEDINNKRFNSFLVDIEISSSIVVPKNIKYNIEFIIGQPNTGKSFNYEESNIFKGVDNEYYKYKKIPVSGGIGNEYKGLQNTDLAITYDPIKEELKFGEFLQMLMSAIVNPKVPHVVFLDDFHNQDISSLLSEYTPLFKSQQMREVLDIDESNSIFQSEFNSIDDFINVWNKFIINHCVDIPIVPLTNRISGNSLNLVFPANFYLLGAANFNENTLNIFADWEDRAKITYKNPIDTFELESEDHKDFLVCCKLLNNQLKTILELENIFDYERYCFGMWKIVESNGNLKSDLEEQKNIIIFFFGMIKNSLKFNNKNSYINKIGWKLIQKMQSDSWFKINIKEIESDASIDYKILHALNIYEDDI